jgi:MFS family permease
MWGYAGFGFVAGGLVDRFDKRRLLAGGYALAAGMVEAVIALPVSVWPQALIFALGGTCVASEETLEDALCAELVGEEYHDMAFGTLATVNGAGDFVSSVLVGALWAVLGPAVAFAC